MNSQKYNQHFKHILYINFLYIKPKSNFNADMRIDFLKLCCSKKST